MALNRKKSLRYGKEVDETTVNNQSNQNELIQNENKKSIIVYTGTMKRIKVLNILFDQNIPTYIPKEMLEQFLKLENFEIWDESKHYETREHRPILIRLANDLKLIISSIPTIYQVQKCYPRSPIAVICPTAHLRLLPGFVYCYKNEGTRIEYYREIDLTQDNLKLNDIIMRNIPLHEYVLQRSGLYDIQQDQYIKPIVQSSKLIAFNRTCMIGFGDRLFEQQYNKIDKIDLNTIGNTNFIHEQYVCIGDSQWTYRALYTGKPCFILLLKTAYKNQIHLKPYPNATIYAYPESEGQFETAIKSIQQFADRLNDYGNITDIQ